MNRDFRKFIENQRKYYKKIGSVACPILRETVYFNSDGFEHLLYKGNRKPRKLNERYMKLKCLEYVPEVIKKADVISETRQSEKRIKGKLKKVTFHELIYKIKEGTQIRVVVEKVGNGKLHFLSVMPHKKRPKPKKRPKGRF